MSTQDANGADLFAPSHGCISAVEVHDHLPQQSSLERGDIKTKPERPILNELHLFAGCGGGILGGILLGHHPVCAVEIEHYCRQVLLQRQRDGVLPRFPVWDDVRTFDGNPWRGRVDVVCGGFPCQDISAAGKGAGLDGERSGLWREMARIIGEIRPGFVLVENSPMLVGRGLASVLSDLTSMGYDARWGVVGAWHCGAPHKRDRIWILANAAGRRLEGWADCESGFSEELVGAAWLRESPLDAANRILGVGNGVAGRMGGLKAVGNGQVPQVVALASLVLSGSVRFRGMRVGLPKGEAVATKGRKYNAKMSDKAEPGGTR